MASTADSVVQWGLSQIGIVYRTGGEFTRTGYAAAGISIPRTAVAQAFRAGVVLADNTRVAPGDLVFPTTRIVQLYIGGGMVLAATKRGIIRTPIRRVWRTVRVVTPGGGEGLALAVPGESTAKIVAGHRRRR